MDLIIETLRERIFSLLEYKEKYEAVPTDFDIYYEAFFTKDVNIPQVGDSKTYKVTYKEAWGYYEYKPRQYRVVFMPLMLTVYHTCSLQSAHQMINYLIIHTQKLKLGKRGNGLTKTFLRSLGSILRAYRPVFKTTYFASGLKYIGEFLGFTDRDMNIGVAVTYYNSETGRHSFMSQKNIDYLRELSSGESNIQTYIPKIFVDSGAFSVGQAFMKYEAGKTKIKPTPLHFEDVLNKYHDMVVWRPYPNMTTPQQFYFVAPDVIANPQASLDQLQKYKLKLDALKERGANLIIPLHDSHDFPMWSFDETIEGMFGKDGYIAGIPTVKGVTKLSRFIEFLKKRKPPRIHFLGMGYTGIYYRPFIEAVQCFSPKTQVFLDAVRLTALVGRAEAKEGESLIDDFAKIRARDKVYTRMRDEAEAELLSEEYVAHIDSMFDLIDNEDRFSLLLSLEKKLRADLDDIDEWISGGELGWLDEYVVGNKELEEELFKNLDYFANFADDAYFNEAQIIKDIISKEPSVAVEITNSILEYKDFFGNYTESPLQILARLGLYSKYLEDFDDSVKEIREKKTVVEKIDDAFDGFDAKQKKLAKQLRRQLIDEIDEIKDESEELAKAFEEYETEDQGIWNDWFWSWYKTFPHTVLKKLREEQRETIKKNEFYAEKTRRAIGKLSDIDLAKIG